MELSGKQREKLQNALIAAFPAKNKLEQMLSFKLDKKLNEISTGNSLAEIVFELITTAEAQNWIEDLIIAAYRQNPGNELLKEFTLKIAIQKEKSSQNPTGIIPELSNIPTTGFEASEVDANYTPLASMLSKRNFKAADKETARIMLWVVRREEEGYLREEDIEKFPYRDLRTIEQLWLTSSGGKFGFSVQKQIWIECGGKQCGFSVQKQIWIECGGKLGEYDNIIKKFMNYVEYYAPNWDLRAPRGHLPSLPLKLVQLKKVNEELKLQIRRKRILESLYEESLVNEYSRLIITCDGNELWKKRIDEKGLDDEVVEMLILSSFLSRSDL